MIWFVCRNTAEFFCFYHINVNIQYIQVVVYCLLLHQNRIWKIMCIRVNFVHQHCLMCVLFRLRWAHLTLAICGLFWFYLRATFLIWLSSHFIRFRMWLWWFGITTIHILLFATLCFQHVTSAFMMIYFVGFRFICYDRAYALATWY